MSIDVLKTIGALFSVFKSTRSTKGGYSKMLLKMYMELNSMADKSILTVVEKYKHQVYTLTKDVEAYGGIYIERRHYYFGATNNSLNYLEIRNEESGIKVYLGSRNRIPPRLVVFIKEFTNLLCLAILTRPEVIEKENAQLISKSDAEKIVNAFENIRYNANDNIS